MSESVPALGSINLGRGKLTLGGPLTEESLQSVKDWEVTHIATLQNSEETPTRAQLLASTLPATWLWLPMSSELPVSESEQAHLQQYLVALRQALMEGGRVYLHCDTSAQRACLILLAMCRYYGMSAGSAYRALHSISATGANALPRGLIGWAHQLGGSVKIS